MRKHSRTNIVAFLIAVVALQVGIPAQTETIPQALARGSNGRYSTAPSGKPPTMNELLQKTDIVVRGIVGNPKSYLSDDERNVYTDYVIVNPVFLYQPQLVPSARPGIVPSVTVTQLGGSITLPNGLTFTQTEQGLLLLEPGTEGLFLLQRVGDQHRLVGTFYGAFRIEAGTLTPLAKRQSFAPEYRGVPATEAEASMVARLQSLRK